MQIKLMKQMPPDIKQIILANINVKQYSCIFHKLI